MGKKESRFDKYVDWALRAMLTGIATYAATLGADMSHNLQDLNTKMAVLISTTSNQDTRLGRLEAAVFKAKR